MATSLSWESSSILLPSTASSGNSVQLNYVVTGTTPVTITFAASYSWVTVSPTSVSVTGTGSVYATASVKTNSGPARSVKISAAVLSAGASSLMTVNQSAGTSATGGIVYWLLNSKGVDAAGESSIIGLHTGLDLPGGAVLLPDLVNVASADTSWLTISPSKISHPNPGSHYFDIVAKANTGPARTTTVTAASMDDGSNDTIEIVQAGGSGGGGGGGGGGTPGSPGETSKEMVNDSIMNHILPFIKDGKPAPECPYAPIYPDNKRTGQDAAVPVVKVTDYLFEPLEPTSDDLVLDMNTGFLLPKTFKAALFSLGNVFTETMVPDSFVAFAGTIGKDKTRVKLSSGTLGTASGRLDGGTYPNGSFYITYGVFDASLIRRDDDLHTSWSGSMNSVTPSKNNTLDPGDEAKVEIMKILQPLKSSGTGQRVVVEDLASPQPAAMCGAVQIGVRPALVKSGGTAAFVASATATPDGFPWSDSAQLAVQSTAAQVVVPISFLCAACGKTTPAMAAALVTEYAQRAAWTIAEAARRYLIPAYTARGITPEAKGWLSCGVEAKCEPQQVQGRPDLYFATLQVNAVVPVRLGKGV